MNINSNHMRIAILIHYLKKYKTALEYLSENCKRNIQIFRLLTVGRFNYSNNTQNIHVRHIHI